MITRRRWLPCLLRRDRFHQSWKGPNPPRASSLSLRRASIGIATLVLDSHRCRIYRFFTCDAFESGENPSIVVLVTLHRKAAL
jgi:hypothetical protein